MADDFEKASRRSWSREDPPTIIDLKLGCLQRIAAATEAMAKNHIELVRQLDIERANSAFWQREAERERRRVSALRGVVTRLKRRAGRGA